MDILRVTTRKSLTIVERIPESDMIPHFHYIYMYGDCLYMLILRFCVMFFFLHITLITYLAFHHLSSHRGSHGEAQSPRGVQRFLSPTLRPRDVSIRRRVLGSSQWKHKNKFMYTVYGMVCET